MLEEVWGEAPGGRVLDADGPFDRALAGFATS